MSEEYAYVKNYVDLNEDVFFFFFGDNYDDNDNDDDDDELHSLSHLQDLNLTTCAEISITAFCKPKLLIFQEQCISPQSCLTSSKSPNSSLKLPPQPIL